MAERTARWRWVKVAQPRPWRPGSEVSILTTTRRTSRGAVKMVRMDRMVKGAMALSFREVTGPHPSPVRSARHTGAGSRAARRPESYRSGIPAREAASAEARQENNDREGYRWEDWRLYRRPR